VLRDYNNQLRPSTDFRPAGTSLHRVLCGSRLK